jgi:alkylation response protein AidB-like acyl-CoA dehydrogenase
LAGAAIPGLGRRPGLSRIRQDAARVVATSDKPDLVQLADLLVSAQLLGIAKACLDLAVAYARVRHQFGKPIGSFQAIKHHCANMAISAELLSAQLDMAAIALRDGRDDAGFQVAALRLLAPQAALDNARLCIQVHGGIGFSAEAEPHRYLKQAHVLRQLGGGTTMLDHPSPMAPHRSDRGDE